MLATWLALIGAGLVAGVFGTMTGVGSVFSYPVLLAAGLSPVSANVTNTVALAIGGAGGAYSSRPELAGRHRLTVRLCLASVLGTIAGSALLLLSSPAVFRVAVPFLVAAASVSILLPRPRRPTDGPDESRIEGTTVASIGMAVVSIYNGYFAAGSSVLMIAALLVTTNLTLTVANGLKNILVLVSDLAAALAFAVFGPVSWSSVPPLAVGLFIGSLIGPPVARRLPVATLRVAIAVAGLGLAVALGVRAL